MSDPPSQRPPASGDVSNPQWSQQLQQGLQALKRQDYLTAQARLQPLVQVPVVAIRLKAQMGLVKAYAGLGQPQRALPLCRQLMAQPHPAARQWAERQLPRLLQGQGGSAPPNAVAPAGTGFVPQDVPTVAAPPLSTADSVAQVGSVPDPDPRSKTAPPPPMDPAANPVVPPDEEGSPQVPPEPAAQASPAPYQAPSLFHYQQLNQEVRSQDSLNPPSAPPPATPASPSPAPVSARPSHARFTVAPVLWPLWGLGLGTALGWLWLLRWVTEEGFWQFNAFLKSIPGPVRFQAIRALYADPTLLVVAVVVAVVVGSPWWLDGWMGWRYGQRPLKLTQLKRHSPEAARLLRRVCQQQGWDLPQLRLLPQDVPLCFSYGGLPRYTRIVVSQGVLEGLDDEALASLYGYQMATLRHRMQPLTTALGLPPLLVHQGYWSVALWGNRQRQPWQRGLAGGVACGLYSLFWLLRLPGLWFSRVRSRCGDITACQFSQSPIAHQRALLQLSQHIARYTVQTGYTHPLLEQLEPWLPVSARLALPLAGRQPWTTVVAWDYANPQRQWLRWNTAHPLLGERLLALGRLAHRVEHPALPLPGHPPSVRQPLSWVLVLQGAGVLGALAGALLALGLWFLGGVVNATDWWRLSWIYGDVVVLRGFIWLGLGLGTLLRVNRLFPEGTPQSAATVLPSLVAQTTSLPIEGHPVVFEGILRGRPGLANWLGQDLFVLVGQDASAVAATMVPLHLVSVVGPWGNGLWRRQHPVHWLNQPVRVVGWLRRSTDVWIDVGEIVADRLRFEQSRPPQWTSLLGLGLSLWGLYIMVTG